MCLSELVLSFLCWLDSKREARQCTRTKTIYREVLREVSLYLHLCLALASAQARAGSSELDVELAERAPHRFGSLRRAPQIPQAKWGKMCVPPGKVGTLLSPRQRGHATKVAPGNGADPEEMRLKIFAKSIAFCEWSPSRVLRLPRTSVSHGAIL